MKKLMFPLFGIAALLLCLFIQLQRPVAALGQDDVFLTDLTGSLFKPTNAARRLGAFESAAVRGGSQILTALETQKAIVFGKSMPDASYIVLATPRLPTSVSWSNPTTNGFTLNLTVGIAGRVDWLAINPQ
jgi:hypothetical protein